MIDSKSWDKIRKTWRKLYCRKNDNNLPLPENPFDGVLELGQDGWFLEAKCTENGLKYLSGHRFTNTTLNYIDLNGEDSCDPDFSEFYFHNKDISEEEYSVGRLEFLKTQANLLASLNKEGFSICEWWRIPPEKPYLK